MKLVKTAFASALALTLMACGGGGGGDSTGTATAPVAAAVLNKTEFLGIWTSPTQVCHPGFRYYSNYWVKEESAVITDTSIELSQIMYTDSICATKAGKTTEKFDTNMSQGSIAGKSNVLRVNLAFTGSVITADGGSGITLSQIPDGNATLGYGKLMWDVDTGVLYDGDPKSALDADGYPTAISTTAFFIR